MTRYTVTCSMCVYIYMHTPLERYLHVELQVDKSILVVALVLVFVCELVCSLSVLDVHALCMYLSN